MCSFLPVCTKTSLGLLSSKTGIKNKLRDSAEYPRKFGMAVGGLIGSRKPPLRPDITDLSYSGAGPDLGALNDLIRGPQKTWWRKLWSPGDSEWLLSTYLINILYYPKGLKVKTNDFQLLFCWLLEICLSIPTKTVGYKEQWTPKCVG